MKPIPLPDFSQYRALRKLSLVLLYDTTGMPLIHSHTQSRSLVALFKHPLPSTLRHILITLNLGCSLDTDWEYTFPRIFDDKDVNLECWNELDQALALQPSVKSVTIRLAWENRRAPYSQERCLLPIPFVLPHAKALEMQESWRENLQVFLARWRNLFGGVTQRGILDLRYIWTPGYLSDS